MILKKEGKVAKKITLLLKNKVFIKNSISIFMLFTCFLSTGIDSIKEVHANYKKVMFYKERYKSVPSINKSNIKIKSKYLMLDSISTISREVIVNLPTILFIYQKNHRMLYNYAIATTGTYAIVKTVKMIAKKERPDGTNDESFPSGHAAQAALGSTYITAAYGFLFGLPMFVLTVLVAAIRVICKKHTLIDVFSGFCIGVTSGIYTPFIAKNTYYLFNRCIKKFTKKK